MQHIRKLPANTNGKDYICGDVHGYYDHVMKLMDHVKFDSAVDRLFFVGDLIDRGPDNILLQLPFVYSVLGNHDYMMIRSVLDGQHPFIWYRNGGLWIESIDEANRVSLAKFLKKKMSLVIVVGTSTTDRFNIMHAQPHLDAHSPNLTDADVNRTPHMSSEELDEADIIWGRSILRGADDRNVDNLSPTYVGHSILSDLYRYGPIYYIDGGACFNDRLTFACHTERIMYNYHVATDTFSSVPYADIEDIRS